MSLRLWFSTLSDVGLVRTKNDDSAYAGPRLLAVADGMGGPPGGDIASALTIDALRELDITSPADQPEREAERLTEATLLANNRISARVDSESRLHGMGTTLTAALFTGDALVFGHIGDSRAYLYRPADRVVADDGTPADATAPPLVQLTKDHSFVQSLVDEGQITPEQAETHSHRSWLIRAVDGRPDNEPDTFFVDLVPGDRVLLCSDGLTGFVAIDAIREALAEAEGPEQACERLVALALDAGAPDNVTCVVAVVLEVDGDETGQVVAVDTLDAQHPMLVGAVANLMGDDSGEITMTAPSEAVGMGHDGDGTSHARHSTEDDEADRYAPQPRSRWRWLRRVGIVVAAVALLVVAGALGYRWTQQQYYVGAASTTEPTVARLQGHLAAHERRASVDGVRDHRPRSRRPADLSTRHGVADDLGTQSRRCPGHRREPPDHRGTLRRAGVTHSHAHPDSRRHSEGDARVDAHVDSEGHPVDHRDRHGHTVAHPDERSGRHPVRVRRRPVEPRGDSVSAAAAVDAGPGEISQFRRRRGAELGLVLFALLTTAAAFAIIDYSILATVERQSIVMVGVFAALALIAHITVRLRAAYADPVLLPCVVFLNGLGLAMIHRLDLASAAAAAANGSPAPRPDALLQLTWTGLAVVVFVLVLVLLPDHRLLQRVTYTAGLLGVVLLLLPLVPGLGRGDPRRAHLDPARAVELPAGRGGQGRDDHLLRRLPGRRSGTPWRSPAVASSASTSPGPATSARCCSAG